MTLRKKIFLIVSLTFLCLAVVLAISSYQILLKGFMEIEEKDARANIQGALSLLNQELATIDATARDYAQWDDMYSYVVVRNQSFIDSNFVASTFSNLKINFIIVTDRNGKIIYGAGFDLNAMKKAPLYKSFHINKKIIPELIISKTGEVIPQSGIAHLPEGFTLLVAKPILNSQGKGAPRGVFITGRFLDDNEISKLGEPLNLYLSIFHINQSDSPPDVQSVWNNLSAIKPVIIKPVDRSTIAGYALLKDLSGKYNLLLRTKEKRPIFQQGMDTIIYVIIFVLFTALVFTVMMVIILEKSVLRRILHISEDVKAIEADGNVSRRIHLDGNDEMASLTRDINNMLGKLELSENRIRSEAEKYRAVIEDQTEFICRFGEDGILTFINDAYYRFFSHNRRVLIGRYFLSFVPDEDRHRIHELLESLTPNAPTAAYELRVIFPDGEDYWQHWTCRAIYDDNCRLLEYQAVGRDITDRRRAENELSTLNRRLEEANAQIGQAYAKMKNNLDNLRKHLFKEEFAFLVDRNGRILGITERVLEFMKLSRNQMIDANMTDFLPTHDRHKFIETIHNAWIGITRQTHIKLIHPQAESESQVFEIKFARLTLEGKRLILVTLR